MSVLYVVFVRDLFFYVLTRSQHSEWSFDGKFNKICKDSRFVKDRIDESACLYIDVL